MSKLVPGRRNTHQKLKRKTYIRDAYTCQLRLDPDCAGDMTEAWERWMAGKITRKRCPITVDHTIPKSKGGKWSLLNLKTACKPCNKAKGDSDPEDVDK